MSLSVSVELFKHHVVICQIIGRTENVIKHLAGKEFYIIVGMNKPLEPRFNLFPGRFASSNNFFLYVKTQRSRTRAAPVRGCSRASYDLMTRISSSTTDIHHFTLTAGCISGHRGHIIMADEALMMQINGKLEGCYKSTGGSDSLVFVSSCQMYYFDSSK